MRNSKFRMKKRNKRARIIEGIVFAILLTIFVSNGIVKIPGAKYNVANINAAHQLGASAKKYASYCSMSRDDAYEKLGRFQDGNGNLKCNIEDQASLGLCWNFAVTKVMELSAQKKFGVPYDFSERYVDYNISNVVWGDDYWRELGGGGSFPLYEEQMSMKKNKFLVQKKDFDNDNYMLYTGVDYSTGISYCTDIEAAISKYNNTKTEDIYVRKITHFTPIEKDEVTNQIITENGEEIRNQIKQCIVDNGSVAFCINMITDYYDDQEATICQDGVNANPMEAPHAITAIGWDDNYPMENFVLYDKYVEAGIDPTERMGNGAYICMNSYGETAGKNGFYYVSYYDHFAEMDVIGVSTDDIFGEDEINIHSYNSLNEFVKDRKKYGDLAINADLTTLTIVVPKSAEQNNLDIPTPVSISATVDKVCLKKDEQAQITIEPADEPIKFYESSNTYVATVNSNGRVTARNEGHAIITAVTENGKYADVIVRVSKEEQQTDPDSGGGHLGPYLPIYYGERVIAINNKALYDYTKRLFYDNIINYDDSSNTLSVSYGYDDPREELVFDMQLTEDDIPAIKEIFEVFPNLKRVTFKNITYKSKNEVAKAIGREGITYIKAYTIESDNDKIKNAIKNNMKDSILSVTTKWVSIDLFVAGDVIDLSNAKLGDGDIDSIKAAFKDRLNELKFNLDNNYFTENANFEGITILSIKNQSKAVDAQEKNDNVDNPIVVDEKIENSNQNSTDKSVSNQILANAGEGWMVIGFIVFGIVFAIYIKKKMK